MSDNRNDNATSGAAFAGMAFLFLAAFAFAAIAFIALILTLWAIAAWERPVTLFRHTLTPPEAKSIFFRGAIGAGILPLFVIFLAVLFKLRINNELLVYFGIGGYSLGSDLFASFTTQESAEGTEKEVTTPALLPPEPVRSRTIDAQPPKPSASDQQLQLPPFRFATWDDEEELRK
jgi:hypothetical protein